MCRTNVGLRSHALWLSLFIAMIPSLGCANGDESADFAEELRNEGEQLGAELAAQLQQETDPQQELVVAAYAAAIISALNEGEIEMSIPVIVMTQRGSVREFAERMVREHQAANTRLLVLLGDQNIEPQESSISLRLRIEASSTALELGNTPADEVDLQYVRQQIVAHAKARVLVGLLATRVTNEAFQAYLTQLARSIDAHLFEAVQLARKLVRDQQEPGDPQQP